MLDQALRECLSIHSYCVWINYVRCHDDIGWTFSDEDATRLGIIGFDHRVFLNAFFTGRFEGSFTRGLPFQENPKTGDVRISGTCASLAGLEKALNEETETEVELAIRQITLIHGVILIIGGIPLIYLNDEIRVLNDYSYRDDPVKTHDSRWVHRPKTDWALISLREDESTVQGRIYQHLKELINLRKSHAAFSGGEMQVINTGSNHVLGYMRVHNSDRIMIFANFSEQEQTIPAITLRLYGLGYEFRYLVTGEEMPFENLKLEAYHISCLAV